MKKENVKGTKGLRRMKEENMKGGERNRKVIENEREK